MKRNILILILFLFVTGLTANAQSVFPGYKVVENISYQSDDVKLKIDKAIAQRALFTEEYNYKIVNPISFIEGYVSLEEATNNAAELIGTLEAIRFCLNIEKEIKRGYNEFTNCDVENGYGSLMDVGLLIMESGDE